MEVITAEQWVADAEYLPVARINKPISAFCEQFQTATAPLKSGTPGIRFRSQGDQFILREVANENTTELLVPVVDATKTPRSVGKVENNLISAMRNLGLRLPSLTSLHKDLHRDRIEHCMGFGLRIDTTMDFRPIDP